MIFNASYPLEAVNVSYPSSERIPLRDFKMVVSSSTIKITGYMDYLLTFIIQKAYKAVGGIEIFSKATISPFASGLSA
jgi:hypothetical protein